MELETKKENPKKLYKSYLGLIFVIIFWGSTPVINPFIYKTVSPTITTFITGIAAVISLIPAVIKKRSEFNRELLKLAIPTGLINSLASIVQKIGLLYTTPARYAFLENLSCVVVPIMMLLVAKKRSGKLKIISVALCLAGCFILSGVGEGGIGIGIGDILCSLAGILYGVNIALTSIFSKKVCVPLYVTVHMIVHTLTSAGVTVALGLIEINGEPISPIYFTPSVWVILLIVALAVISNTLCWVLRTNALRDIDATVVAVMMPFSAVITSVVSIIIGLDVFTPTFLVGAVTVLAASIMSGLADIKKK